MKKEKMKMKENEGNKQKLIERKINKNKKKREMNTIK